MNVTPSKTDKRIAALQKALGQNTELSAIEPRFSSINIAESSGAQMLQARARKSRLQSASAAVGKLVGDDRAMQELAFTFEDLVFAGNYINATELNTLLLGKVNALEGKLATAEGKAKSSAAKTKEIGELNKLVEQMQQNHGALVKQLDPTGEGATMIREHQAALMEQYHDMQAKQAELERNILTASLAVGAIS